MSLTYWRDDCKVNHPQIDQEHHYLLEILENLYHAVLQDHSEDLLQSFLDTLFGATLEHCEAEESLMEIFSYPDQYIHMKQHEEILGLILNYRLTLEQGLRPLTLDDVHDLATWLNRHIGTHDLKMVQYVQHRQKHDGAMMGQAINHNMFAAMA